MEAMETSQQPPLGEQQSQLPPQLSQDDVHSYKSKLQQYAQRVGLDLPMYHIKVKGEPHALRFTCSIMIDDETYESPSSFSQKKAAEQNAAKYALECIMNTMETSQQPPLREQQSQLPQQLPRNDIHSYKSKLQQYAQRAGLDLPMYHIKVKEERALRFTCSVMVDDETYESPSSFSQKKAAEQNAAKYALECIMEKRQEIGSSIIRKNTTLCKAILNEFAAKLQIERPKYNPVQIQQVPVPLFVSKLEFRGVSYTGGPARTKKDAEKSVAHGVTLSILGHSEEDSTLLEIIRSKANLFSATQLTPDPSYAMRPEEGSDSASDEEPSKDATKSSPPPLQTEITPPVQTCSTEQFKVTSESPAVESVMLVPSSSQNPATPTTMQVFENQGCEDTSSMHKVNSLQMFTEPPQNLKTTPQNDANEGCEVTCELPHEALAAVVPNQECPVLCALQSTKKISRNQKKANKKARLID